MIASWTLHESPLSHLCGISQKSSTVEVALAPTLRFSFERLNCRNCRGKACISYSILRRGMYNPIGATWVEYYRGLNNYLYYFGAFLIILISIVYPQTLF